MPTLCSEFQSVPHAAGKSQRQASRAARLAAPTLDRGGHQELLWAPTQAGAPSPGPCGQHEGQQPRPFLRGAWRPHHPAQPLGPP